MCAFVQMLIFIYTAYKYITVECASTVLVLSILYYLGGGAGTVSLTAVLHIKFMRYPTTGIHGSISSEFLPSSTDLNKSQTVIRVLELGSDGAREVTCWDYFALTVL